MTDPSKNKDEKAKQLTPAELAIIEMLKKQNISAQAVSLQQEGSSQQHAFWDSQVIALCVYRSACSFDTLLTFTTFRHLLTHF